MALLDEDTSPTATANAVPQLPFSAYSSLLSRSPTRQSPAIDVAVAQGEALPPSVELPVEDAP